MTETKIYISKTLLLAIACMLLISCSKSPEDTHVRVLILSGKNNHEWQKTTPLLSKIYCDAKIFSVTTTDLPDTLKYDNLKKFDVVVSNWNTWPDTTLRMTPEWEQDFIRYITEGGGAVSIHAGGSSFYTWNEYHKSGIGRWGTETSHGKPAKGKIHGFDQSHPITKGIRDFYITDELWEKTEIHPDAIALAELSSVDETDGHQIYEKALFISQTGKGKSFYTILGHDERALLNTGLQTLLIRGTLWSAGREVNTDLPAELKKQEDIPDTLITWHQSDSTIGLKKGADIIWQYNFNNRFGRQYFHPVSALKSTLTCVSPPDHSWHMGLWFSWKFINGINYWEYLDDYISEETGYRSAGTTQIKDIKFTTDNSFSADILLDIQYQPSGSDPVMSEKCNLHISPPTTEGSYYIDFDHTFSPVSGEVVLDRTPITGEPGGQSWGGYSGLSVRFSQDYTSASIISPDTANNHRKNPWIYMGFKTLTGNDAGICIIQDPEYTTEVSSWYIINDPSTPFYYYSPAAIYDGKIVLKKGEELRLKYRVWIIPGKTGTEELERKYNSYLNK